MSVQSSIKSIYKPIGKTPLECVIEYKKKYYLDDNVIVSYAGRLDPMAEGILLLLIGDANKKRRQYEHFDKEYKIDLLFGYSTDTQDLMGKVIQNQSPINYFSKQQLIDATTQFVGVIQQQYPIFSSIKIGGKPLFWYAKHDKLVDISIPSHQVEIQSIIVGQSRQIMQQELLDYIEEIIPKVKGNFRQQEIIDSWNTTLLINSKKTLLTIQTLTVLCSAGTYMRTLAKDIGQVLGVPTCIYGITRTRVGDYKLSDCILIF